MKRLLLTILIISLAGFALAQNTTKLKSNLTIEKSAPMLYLNGTSAGIDFYNGDVTLQQSSNTLTLGGGNFSLGANSLLGTGSIGATGTRLLKGWFTDLEITNLPTVNGAAFKTALALTASDVGLGNVTNESKATMFTNPTFTGTLYTAGNIIPTQMYGNTALGTSQYPIGNIIINQGNGISWNNTYWDPLATDVGIFECEGGLDIWADSLRLVPGSFGTPARPVVLGYFTDLDVTNAIAGSITGNAATVTGFTRNAGTLTMTGGLGITLAAPVGDAIAVLVDGDSSFVHTPDAYTDDPYDLFPEIHAFAGDTSNYPVPDKIGNLFINTATSKVYVSVSTSRGGWVILNMILLLFYYIRRRRK